MTVIGTNLNSVAFPVIHALVTIFTVDLQNSSQTPIVIQLNDSQQVHLSSMHFFQTLFASLAQMLILSNVFFVNSILCFGYNLE